MSAPADDDDGWRFSVEDVGEDEEAGDDEEGAVFGPRPDEGATEVLPGDPSVENVVFFVLGVATSLLLLADLAGLL